jgi:hypothetical protein
LPTPTIGATTATQAGKYFNPVLWTSTGTTQSISGVGFQPDLVWSKPRNAVGQHYLNDAVRGASKYLSSSTTNAEGTDVQFLTSFDSDGFSYGTSQFINAQTLVTWAWKANGSGSTNTSGTITSTVSANTTSGFSIVTYSGQSAAGTIGHGLGVAPSWIIVKNRSSASPGAWTVYSSYLGNTSLLFLNTTDSVFTGNTAWNSTSPTSSVFSVGPSSLSVNTVGNNFVAYCFAEVTGYSKFGSYTGNSSTAGPFVYCGFEPAFLLIKNTSSGNWVLKDNKRSTSNVVNKNLFPNLSNAETTEYPLDFLSNGFKLNDISADVNASGQTYIFMAFASAPLKYTLAF